MKLPKLYRAVTIEFSSLRLVHRRGAVLEVDAIVTRKARRVLFQGSWTWVIVSVKNQWKWDPSILIDQESLDELGGTDDILWT